MNQTIYETLLPLKSKWENYKNHHFSEFTNQDFEIVREAYAKTIGIPPRNTNCQSCIRELLRQVFLQFDNFQPIQTNDKTKTLRKRR